MGPEAEVRRATSPRPAPALRLALLGPLALMRAGVGLELTGPKRRALLTLLALHAGSPLSRDRIVDALWPERQTGREESTLRVHISHLRDVLEAIRDDQPRVIVTVGPAYMLSGEHIEVDLDRFDRLRHDGRALLGDRPDEALRALNEALGLWRGRPLQDVEYEEFAQPAIRRLEQARVGAIEDRAEALIELGDDVAAIDDLESLVRTDPTRERPVRLLMRALYRTGGQADALRVARRHIRHLVEQGLAPSPQVDHLQQRILQHDPSLLPEGVSPRWDLGPGRSVRSYELRSQVGAGPTGTIFRAFQSSVGREVAVKVIHPRLAGSPDVVRRFVEEARVVAGLEHPHIVPLNDFWRDPAGAFMVLRWMDGGSLDDRLGQRWQEEDLGRVFGQLAEALGYAHSVGVVHGDLKASNVLFDGPGNAYLSDFRLAVLGAAAGNGRPDGSGRTEAPDVAPEPARSGTPTVASDVHALGMLLARAACGRRSPDPVARVEGPISEVVRIATARDPADRYPDVAAFHAALVDAVGTRAVPLPRRVRRNPYRGLAPFTEGDRAVFYGRDDVVETLLDAVASEGLTAIIGPSGSGKSSVVLAGLVPQLREGALPGSDEWSYVHMVPGTDPFEEFHLALRSVAVTRPDRVGSQRTGELRAAFDAALDGPNARALLVVDQFEEVFASPVDEATRRRFLDDLVALAADPAHHVRVVLTLRADFADRPLAYDRFGDRLARGSLLLAPMQPEQLEEVIRRPAARVGVRVEPGLVAEIVRDVTAAPASLPLLQYVLSELFERRDEDRLTVQDYRALGGAQGVLERRAEATFTSLGSEAQRTCRQLFLRMVQLGDHGEATRRRLPVTELHGLGGRADAEAALGAFTAARLLTYDRDPITRGPTVEVAHETVIHRWARYRIWIDEARADLLAHRRLSVAATAWTDADEDPAYLLTGGPLAAASELASGDRLRLNEREARFVDESRRGDEAARELEARREAEAAVLTHRARRRLVAGLMSAAIAALVAVVAAFAWVERQRADDLAATQERQSTARELAAASVANLTSADPERSLLLALEAAELSLQAGEEVLPEVVEALHRAVINPRPALVVEGAGSATGGQLVAFTPSGRRLVMLNRELGVSVHNPWSGQEMGRLPPVAPAAFGIDVDRDGERIMTIHPDGVRQWHWRSGEVEFALEHPVAVTTAVYSRDGSSIAIGGEDGVIVVWREQEVIAELAGGHDRSVTSIAFDPTGSRLISGGRDRRVLVWDLATESVVTAASTDRIVLPIWQVAWHPSADAAAITTNQGEMYLIDTATGERLNSYGTGQSLSRAIAFDRSGSFLVAAGADGFARLFGTWTGGEPALVLPTGGVPLLDIAFDPSALGVVTVGVDGRVLVWRDLLRSELPPRATTTLYPQVIADPSGDRYIWSANGLHHGVPEGEAPRIEVFDAATRQRLLSRPAFTGWELRRPAISRDGASVAFAGVDGHVEVVEVDTEATTVIPGSADWTATLDFSPDGGFLAGGGVDGSIRLWDAATGGVVRTFEGHGAPLSTADDTHGATFRVRQVVFRPDGTGLVSVGDDGTVRVWDAATGRGRVIHTGDHEIHSVAHSPVGTQLAVADRVGTILLLDADSGQVVDVLEPVSGRSELVFAPDGRYLAGAGPGPLVHLWDLEDGGRIVRRFQGAVYVPRSAAFVQGGTELRVAGGEGIDRRYVLDPVRLVEVARTHVTRDLSDDECQQYLHRPCDG